MRWGSSEVCRTEGVGGLPRFGGVVLRRGVCALRGRRLVEGEDDDERDLQRRRAPLAVGEGDRGVLLLFMGERLVWGPRRRPFEMDLLLERVVGFLLALLGGGLSSWPIGTFLGRELRLRRLAMEGSLRGGGLRRLGLDLAPMGGRVNCRGGRGRR